MKPLLFGLAALAVLQADEAQALFRKMEEKIVQAKTLRVSVAGEAEAAKFKLSGALLSDEGARLRFDIDGKVADVPRTAAVISDGKRVHMTSSDRQDPRRFDAPATYGKLVRLSFARAGFLSSFEFSDSEVRAKTDPETAYSVAGFQAGPKEKVGEREAQVVTYTVTRMKRNASVSLWIDLETHLPLKRTLEMDGMRLTETYSDVTLDEKLDAAKFEVPKEEK